MSSAGTLDLNALSGFTEPGLQDWHLTAFEPATWDVADADATLTCKFSSSPTAPRPDKSDVDLLVWGKKLTQDSYDRLREALKEEKAAITSQIQTLAQCTDMPEDYGPQTWGTEVVVQEANTSAQSTIEITTHIHSLKITGNDCKDREVEVNFILKDVR